MYPRMAKEAKEEGFNQHRCPVHHGGTDREGARGALPRPGREPEERQGLSPAEEQQVWQCRNCGYTYIGKSAPLKCPVCAHPQSYFELKKINY